MDRRWPVLSAKAASYGTRRGVSATNNLLLDLQQIHELDLRFDERFGLTGRSDTLFTRQLAKRGALMLWCDEATVIDRFLPRG